MEFGFHGSRTPTTSYINDANGQIMSSRELDNGGTVGPLSLYYYFDGARVGDVSTNGALPSQVDYAQELAQQAAQNGSASPPTNGYRTGKPVSSADFDQNYLPVNREYPAQASGTYTVRAHDTLQSIAASLWGDATLWYLIADANGLSQGSQLIAGERIIIPNKVANEHNNTGTFQPYNPGEAIGDTLPTLPPEPAPPPVQTSGGDGCGGIFVAILTAVLTVVNPVGGFIGVALEIPGTRCSRNCGFPKQSTLVFRNTSFENKKSQGMMRFFLIASRSGVVPDRESSPSCAGSPRCRRFAIDVGEAHRRYARAVTDRRAPWHRRGV